MLPLLLLLPALAAPNLLQSDSEDTKLNIHIFNNCPSAYTVPARNLTVPEGVVDFLNSKVTVIAVDPVTKQPKADPSVLTVPGCMRAKIENVKFNEPLKNLVAEFSIRMNQYALPLVKDPYRDTHWQSDHQDDPFNIPCAKDEKNCDCGDDENSCLRCGFCNSLSAFDASTGQTVKITKDKPKHGNKLKFHDEQACNCDASVEPGTYTIETDICTPDKETLDSLPFANQLLEELASSNDKAIPMWATIYLYNKKPNGNMAKWGKKHYSRIAEDERNRRTVGCFLMSFEATILRHQ